MHNNNDAHRKINVLIDERWMLNNKSAQKIINALINERWMKHKKDAQKLGRCSVGKHGLAYSTQDPTSHKQRDNQEDLTG